jgi:hypothetical protein
MLTRYASGERERNPKEKVTRTRISACRKYLIFL